jgi:branched-chain amino acid transport system permease protein
MLLLVQQLLNGVQFGLMLFLMAAGLTLVFGIVNLINLAHGSLYMIGAFIGVSVQQWTGSFVWAVILAVPATALVGIAMEVSTLRTLYARPRLDQVLCTFGLILLLNELAKIIWGPASLRAQLPAFLSGTVRIVPGLDYPAFRFAVIVAGLVVAGVLYLLISRTRIGMLIRAGASDRDMVAALGVDIKTLFTLVFGLGAALAGLAGIMAAPIYSVQVGMGDGIVILTLVVIVIGGIGSVRGALAAALLVGIVDTYARVLLPASIGQICIYVLMAGLLFIRPRGLLPANV